jgi:hypothetical protein
LSWVARNRNDPAPSAANFHAPLSSVTTPSRRGSALANRSDAFSAVTRAPASGFPFSSTTVPDTGAPGTSSSVCFSTTEPRADRLIVRAVGA